jgi:hypothetical protein
VSQNIMMLRATACCAALAVVLGLLSGPSATAAPACDGTECRPPANGKPLNIMQFMRKQAASTRKVEPRPAHRTVAARPKPAQLPAEAAASFASQPESDVQASDVQVVASDEFNAIDRAAAAAPAETAGTAVPTGPDVQLVDAEEFNDIDRKADDGKVHVEQANVSWLRWIWSALGSTFAALATAMHQLIGLG